MDNQTIKPTTKAILIYNVDVGNLPKDKAQKHTKKMGRRLRKMINLPEDFVLLLIPFWMGRVVPSKILEFVRLDGTNKEEPMFSEEWIDKMKEQLSNTPDITWSNNTVICDKVFGNFIQTDGEEEKSNLINVRISDDDKEAMLEKSEELGFKNLSDYLRFVGLNAELKVVVSDINNNDTQ